MSTPDIEYDVYQSPKIGIVQLGDFVAAKGSERMGIVRSAKYFRRGHRARAWFAKDAITKFLTNPSRNIGHLDAALHEAKEKTVNTHGASEDLEASRDTLQNFIGFTNKFETYGKEFLPIEDQDTTYLMSGTAIKIELSCLVRSTNKDGEAMLGGIFLNTQVGKGLGKKPETVSKRILAGETVAITILDLLNNRYSDIGQPYHKDALHLYVRQKHAWHAPRYHSERLKNIQADASTIRMMWDQIDPPKDFDPKKAKIH